MAELDPASLTPLFFHSPEFAARVERVEADQTAGRHDHWLTHQEVRALNAANATACGLSPDEYHGLLTAYGHDATAILPFLREQTAGGQDISVFEAIQAAGLPPGPWLDTPFGSV